MWTLDQRKAYLPAARSSASKGAIFNVNPAGRSDDYYQGRSSEHYPWVCVNDPVQTDAQALPEVAVVTGFWELDDSQQKHTMAEYETFMSSATDVDAPYLAFGNSDVLQRIEEYRLGRSQTTSAFPQSLAELLAHTAKEVGVTDKQLHEAANLSVVEGHCPSAEVVVIWVSKPFVVQQGIALANRDLALAGHLDGFAWMDAGGSPSRQAPQKPPPNPWNTFWPMHGLAVKFARSACHNGLGGRSIQEAHDGCIIGGMMYGSVSAWQAFTAAYATVLRERILSGHGGLCSEQDLFTDVWKRDPLLFDRFDSTNGQYGWDGAFRPASTRSLSNG